MLFPVLGTNGSDALWTRVCSWLEVWRCDAHKQLLVGGIEEPLNKEKKKKQAGRRDATRGKSPVAFHLQLCHTRARQRWSTCANEKGRQCLWIGGPSIARRAGGVKRLRSPPNMALFACRSEPRTRVNRRPHVSAWFDTASSEQSGLASAVTKPWPSPRQPRQRWRLYNAFAWLPTLGGNSGARPRYTKSAHQGCENVWAS